MKEYTLDNGWIVRQDDSGAAVLHVVPITNSIFRKEQYVEIPQAVFDDIESGEIRVKELFRKHHLHNLIFQWGSREPVTLSKPINTPNEFYGRDYIAVEEDRFYLIYELSSHGGGNRKIPVSKEVYEFARSDEFSITDLFKKFDLYHLDVPVNDVK